ncbi:hypothetical protein V6N13_134580 [Hibiscus sabdariffa]
MIAGFWRCWFGYQYFSSQVKRRYRIAPALPFSDRRRNHSMLFSEARQRVSPRFDRDDVKVLTESQIDLELARTRNMTPEEAAAAAARAVAEAEAAIAEAEEAAREAEVAEADAEASQAFTEAAMKTIKGRNNQKVVNCRLFSLFILHMDICRC